MPEVVLLSEVRADFTLPWSAIEVFERGAPVLDTGPAEVAAREVALAEDRIALYGDPVGNGFLTSPKSPRVQAHDWTKPGQVLADVMRAVETLDGLGIAGPYEAVLPPARYYAYLQAVDETGYPTARQLKDVGDLAAGYRQHDRDAVHLFCGETIAPQMTTPDAVCLLEG